VPGSAKAYLPDTSKWPFEAHDIDLVSWADPIGHGIELIQDAHKTPDAPRKYADKSPKLGRFTLAMQLSASAIKCLNKHSHLELHAYVDRQYACSVSVVLVIDT
jgi:hypothetical protein